MVLLSRQKEKDRSEGDTILRVEDVMVREVVTINGDYSVRNAAEIMNKFEIGSLIVVNEGKTVGIMTERDVLKRVVAESRDARKTKVKDVMTSPLIVTAPKIELEEAVKLMFQMKIKKLPVVDGKRLVGLLSLTDVARFHPQMTRMLKQLANSQATPKSMKKIVDRYIV